MKGIDVKRGVAATMERIVANTGSAFRSLEVKWFGNTAGINFERHGAQIDATVVFPALDELAEVDRGTFNNLIGFALHEGLGHALYTNNEPWDDARTTHGQYVGKLINGLEDPRIEQRAIDSGFAPNSKFLFENLLNAVLERDGYVKPDDLKNIPFLLAVEGRRLNGYHVNVPSITDQSPLAVHLHEALESAKRSINTEGVVLAAVKLYEQIKKYADEQQGSESKPKGDGKGDQKKPPTDDSDASQGDSQGNPLGQPEQGKQDSDQGDPSGQGDPSDKSGEKGGSKGKLDGGRKVDPASFIESEVKNKAMASKGNTPRPYTNKPVIETFTWEQS
jgi:hypothetical protein